MRRFHTDSNCSQCCSEFSWDGALVCLCVLKFSSLP